ncbi:MAG: hypothetical protein ACLSG9_05805 [Eubacterium sp.]
MRKKDEIEQHLGEVKKCFWWEKDSMKVGSFFVGRFCSGAVHLQIQKIKVPVCNGKRREEKKIEKKFDCTQRAVLIWMKIWNV